jgi:hypothetical protein
MPQSSSAVHPQASQRRDGHAVKEVKGKDGNAVSEYPLEVLYYALNNLKVTNRLS